VAIIKSKFICRIPDTHWYFAFGFGWWEWGLMSHTYGFRIMLGWYQWIVRWPRFFRSAKTQPTTHKGQNAGSTFARL